MGLMHVYTRHLNTTTVVVLQIVFHYEILYEMGPPMLEKHEGVPVLCRTPSLCLGRGRGVTVSSSPRQTDIHLGEHSFA